MNLAPVSNLAGNICHPIDRAEYSVEKCAAVIEAAITQVGNEQDADDQRNGQKSRAEVGLFNE